MSKMQIIFFISSSLRISSQVHERACQVTEPAVLGQGVDMGRGNASLIVFDRSNFRLVSSIPDHIRSDNG